MKRPASSTARADGQGWLVYYSERGGKSPLSRHATEDGAVRDMLARLNIMLKQAGMRPLP